MPLFIGAIPQLWIIPEVWKTQKERNHLERRSTQPSATIYSSCWRIGPEFIFLVAEWGSNARALKECWGHLCAWIGPRDSISKACGSKGKPDWFGKLGCYCCLNGRFKRLGNERLYFSAWCTYYTWLDLEGRINNVFILKWDLNPSVWETAKIFAQILHRSRSRCPLWGRVA